MKPQRTPVVGPGTWSVVAVACVALVVMTGVQYPGVWPWLGIFPMAKGPFGDLEALLASGETAAAGLDPFSPAQSLDYYHRPHVYGPLFLLSGSLGLTVAHTFECGAALVLAWLTWAVREARVNSAGACAAFCAVVLSPPILLALERANNDLLMVLIVVCAGWVLAAPGRLAWPGAGGLVALAAWLKLYPAVACVALGATPGPRRGAWRAIIWTATTIAAGFVLWAFVYLRVLELAPSIKSVFTYGFLNSGSMLWQVVLGWGAVGVGFILVLTAANVWFLRDWRSWVAWIPETGGRALVLVSSGAAWLGCLAAGASFQYRAVWLLPFVWSATGGGPARRLWWWLVLFLWSGWPQFQLINRLVPALTLDSPTWVILVVASHHVLVLASAGLIGLMVVGWVWRRLLAPAVQSSAADSSAASTV